MRILKNKTGSECIVTCGAKTVVIPAQDQADLAETFAAWELASCDGLLTLLAQGVDYYQLNDGTKDLTLGEAVDLVRGYSQKAPLTTDSEPIFAPSPTVVEGYNGCFNGFRFPITAGAQNFHDILLTHNIRIQGGWRRLLCMGTVPDTDYMELSVVDKDNVTGMFDGTDPNGMNPTLIDLELEVGVDVLEMFKYVRTHYACDADKDKRYDYEFPSAKFVPAGLYLRAMYYSTGDTDLVLLGDYKWYEA